MARIEDAVSHCLKELNFVVTKGLSVEQAQSVLMDFENEILPNRLQPVTNGDDSLLAGRLEIVVDDYAKMFAGQTADQKLALVQGLKLQVGLDILSSQSLESALKLLRGQPIDKNACAMGLIKARRLSEEVKKLPESLRLPFEETISETLLDLHYALGSSNAMSFRLSHHPEAQAKIAAPKTTIQCQECGKESPIGTSVCPRCGVALGEAPKAAEPTPRIDPPTTVTGRLIAPESNYSEPTAPVCKKCGATLLPGKKFCTKCGTPV